MGLNLMSRRLLHEGRGYAASASLKRRYANHDRRYQPRNGDPYVDTCRPDVEPRSGGLKKQRTLQPYPARRALSFLTPPRMFIPARNTCKPMRAHASS
jgi:hypothetical protein